MGTIMFIWQKHQFGLFLGIIYCNGSILKIYTWWICFFTITHHWQRHFRCKHDTWSHMGRGTSTREALSAAVLADRASLPGVTKDGVRQGAVRRVDLAQPDASVCCALRSTLPLWTTLTLTLIIAILCIIVEVFYAHSHLLLFYLSLLKCFIPVRNFVQK